MAINPYGSLKELQSKTHFTTREGVYTLMPLIEYYRPTRTQFSLTVPLNFVRLSLVSVPRSCDKLCLNIGRELYVFIYKGIKSGADLATIVDKRVYKMMNPTCHSFNHSFSDNESLPLLIGFSSGIIQVVDVVQKDISKMFNEEKLIDKTKVTCIQWVPNSRHLFLSSHASGQLYLYNEELPCSTSPPNYQLFKHGNGYAIHVCKTKSTRNPLYRWVIGSEGCCINEFAFSPCKLFLAVVSQDGFLRVFHYDTMELIGVARSYFGGFLCVCWSPDGKYVAVGGEDDLVTIWSFDNKQIIARGQGHHSWVNVVAFDPYTSNIGMSDSNSYTTYRLGSVGQDTQLCLWEITEDVLRQPVMCSKLDIGYRNSTYCSNGDVANHVSTTLNHNHNNNNNYTKDNQNEETSRPSQSITQRLASLGFSDKKDKKSNRPNNDKANHMSSSEYDDPMRLIGTTACPRYDQCPLLEPLVCKKVSDERLCALVFKEDCILITCYDGSVSSWARPGAINNSNAHLATVSNNCMSNLTSSEATSTVV